MKKILIFVAIFALFLTQASSIALFNLIRLPKTTGAMCMDGSQYGFY